MVFWIMIMTIMTNHDWSLNNCFALVFQTNHCSSHFQRSKVWVLPKGCSCARMGYVADGSFCSGRRRGKTGLWKSRWRTVTVMILETCFRPLKALKKNWNKHFGRSSRNQITEIGEVSEKASFSHIKHNAEVKYGNDSYYENCEPCQRTIEVCSGGVIFADQEHRHQRLNLTWPKAKFWTIRKLYFLVTFLA